MYHLSLLLREERNCTRAFGELRALHERVIVHHRDVLGDTILDATFRPFSTTNVAELTFAEKQLLHILLQALVRQHWSSCGAPQLSSQSRINKDTKASFEFRNVDLGSFNIIKHVFIAFLYSYVIFVFVYCVVPSGCVVFALFPHVVATHFENFGHLIFIILVIRIRIATDYGMHQILRGELLI